ncbi:hypothetical protein PV08_03788 [Exophiala spinifera]|uniref:Uncharacterized protein n=1 Tax=Exophiala spinifera TaxID=91928 RepID=A0A0D2BDC3_9EURO|nr:uncharacterized protein PV08_03788 [Exophiala spinifera]KIW16600.1 hypothetical protein PV08_03788 [Exophiala spinifera]
MAGIPAPWNMAAAPPPGLTGKVEYRYFTKDGGPPNQGKPPSPPAASQTPSSGPPPPYCLWPSPAPPQAPTVPTGPTFFIPTAPGFPGAVCFQNATPPAPPAPPSGPAFWFQGPGPAPGVAPAPPGPTAASAAVPPPPPPMPSAPAAASAASAAQAPPAPAYNFAAAVGQAALQGPEPPVSGNRVKDRLVVLKDSGGTGYVAPKHNTTFHLWNNNILSKYQPNCYGQFYIPPEVAEPFRVMSAPCSMTMQELIMQLDCDKVPGTHQLQDVGLAEVLDCGSGWFVVGSKISLADKEAKWTLKDLWGSDMGEAEQTRPRYLTRFLGKGTWSCFGLHERLAWLEG